MNAPTLAKDIMVTKLVTLTPRMDVYQAIDLLLKHKISGAPVIDEDRNFLGSFSEKCCLSVLLKAAYEQLPTTEIEPFIDTEARTITEETDLLTIAHIFTETGCRQLPVLRDALLVGQVSRRDVLRAAHQMIAVAPSHERALLYLSSLVERGQAPL